MPKEIFEWKLKDCLGRDIVEGFWELDRGCFGSLQMGDLWYRGTYGFSNLVKNSIQNDAPETSGCLLNGSIRTSHWYLKLLCPKSHIPSHSSCPSVSCLRQWHYSLQTSPKIKYQLSWFFYFLLLSLFIANWISSSWNSTSAVSFRSKTTDPSIIVQQELLRTNKSTLWGQWLLKKLRHCEERKAQWWSSAA